MQVDRFYSKRKTEQLIDSNNVVDEYDEVQKNYDSGVYEKNEDPS